MKDPQFQVEGDIDPKTYRPDSLTWEGLNALKSYLYTIQENVPYSRYTTVGVLLNKCRYFEGSIRNLSDIQRRKLRLLLGPIWKKSKHFREEYKNVVYSWTQLIKFVRAVNCLGWRVDVESGWI